ncbi:hypothetical protein ACQEVZ_39380 [Dactylosporangium sp. CA-152071]|uniref:hypothetical protein n=1 Tax=Dactylosporangium sp. CA-152071 TaxID=3239933 RepID=UPI003D8B6FE3
MSDEDGADLFEASLLLVAGTAPPGHATAARRRTDWQLVAAAWEEAPLRAEFEAAYAAARFAEVMRAVPAVDCWTGRREAGIRRRYETFVVDVAAADPGDVLGRLEDEWTRGADLLLGDGAADETRLRTRAVAVWRCALLTAAPRHSTSGMRLRARDGRSLRLLARSAQVLGVPSEAHTGRGRQILSVGGRGAVKLRLATHVTPTTERSADGEAPVARCGN